MNKEVSFLGHRNSLYNALTVLENIQFINRLFSRRNGKDHTEHILKIHGLWERRNDPVSELSQGMKRRLAIVKGFISNPKLFIMDEPFIGLDLKWRSAVLSTIKNFKEAGNSLVLTTHLVEEGYELADNIAFLHKGKLMFLKRKDKVNIEDIKILFHSLEKH
jgi:ABC-2 type transport system ATP-binding protein